MFLLPTTEYIIFSPLIVLKMGRGNWNKKHSKQWILWHLHMQSLEHHRFLCIRYLWTFFPRSLSLHFIRVNWQLVEISHLSFLTVLYFLRSPNWSNFNYYVKWHANSVIISCFYRFFFASYMSNYSSRRINESLKPILFNKFNPTFFMGLISEKF